MKRKDSPIEVCATVEGNDKLYDMAQKQKIIAKRSMLTALLDKIQQNIDELKNKQ